MQICPEMQVNEMQALYDKHHTKGWFTRYDFVTYDMLTTGLRHELFLVNQTYNSLTIVV